MGPRDIEAILADRGAADPPTAARIGRMVGGRPGIALAYAYAPDALRIRSELARVLLDLLDAAPSERLAAMRAAMPQALAMAADFERGASLAGGVAGAGVSGEDDAAGTGRPRRSKGAAAGVRTARATPPAPEATDDPDADEADPDTPARSVSAPLRRRAAEALVLVWTEVARDLALVAAGGATSIHDPAMLEETTAAAAGLAPEVTVDALRRLERAGTLIAANVSPELVLDALAIGWPRRRAESAA